MADAAWAATLHDKNHSLVYVFLITYNSAIVLPPLGWCAQENGTHELSAFSCWASANCSTDMSVSTLVAVNDTAVTNEG